MKQGKNLSTAVLRRTWFNFSSPKFGCCDVKVCREEWKKSQALYTTAWQEGERKRTSAEVREVWTGKEKELHSEDN